MRSRLTKSAEAQPGRLLFRHFAALKLIVVPWNLYFNLSECMVLFKIPFLMQKYYIVSLTLSCWCLAEYTFIKNSSQNWLKLVSIEVSIGSEFLGHTLKYKWHM